MDISPDVIISLIGIITFGLLIIPTALRWRTKENATYTLFFYLALSLVWNVGILIKSLAVSQNAIPQTFFGWVTSISQVAMPVVFGALTPAFFKRTRILYRYWIFGVIILSAWLVIKLNIYDVAGLITSYLPPNTELNIVSYYMTFLIWGTATVMSLWVLHTGFKAYPQAQYRNRFIYWLGGILILTAANILILLEIPNLLWIGALVNIIGSLLVTYTIIKSHPPVLKLVTAHILQSVAMTTILGIILFALLNTAYLMNTRQVSSGNVLLWLIVMSIAAALVLPQLTKWLEELLGKILIGTRIDETGILHNYSQNVSSDWDFAKLSTQALQFILQEMQVEKGAIFIDDGDGSGHVTLRLIAEKEMPQLEIGYFFGNNPLIEHLRQKQTSVTQYDLDVLPEYQAMDEICKLWLGNVKADIFLPLILRRKQMVGILALGPKPGHKPYLPQDLARLHALTNQIALDLDKAKLFGQLGAVNQKLGELSSEITTVDKGKTDFLSIASHELRTPLTHIHGYTSMLLEATDEDVQNPEYLQYILNGIARGSTRLKDVVDLVFDVSRADIGKLDIIANPVNLTDVIRQAEEGQRSAIEQRNHTLIISGVDQLPTIEGGRDRLAQAVSHLLNNAIKYTPDGGTITITGRRVNEDEDNPKVELIITDTGIGVAPHDHKRIFEKFYRVGNVEHHSTSSVKFKGAGPGLGLPLVKGIVRAHGGDIWVESPEYNEKECPGSQFHLVLPVKAPARKLGPIPNVTDSMAETRLWRSEDIKIIKEKVVKEKLEEERKKSAE